MNMLSEYNSGPFLVGNFNSDVSFVGRQPILDRHEKISGFELLFRPGDCPEAGVKNIFHASMNVLLSFLGNMEIQEAIGPRKRGFLNVGRDLLMSDMIEWVPKDRMIIELLETIKIDRSVITRCRKLKEMGFHLALDDFIYDPVYDPLLELVDIVKIDLLQTTPSSVQETVARLKPYPVTLLAEKVESLSQYEDASAMGFDLFQGYYFARPTVISGKRIKSAEIIMA